MFELGTQQQQQLGPDFLCVGMQKAGTTWLYDQLRGAVGIWMPPIKELHFFDGRFPIHKCRNLSRQTAPPSGPDAAFLSHALTYDRSQSIPWYRDLFAAKGRSLSGDITPAYSALTAEEVKEITRSFADLRIILLIRNPIDRLWSQVGMRHRRGRHPDLRPSKWSTIAAMLEEPDVAKRSYPTQIYDLWSEAINPDRIFLGFFDDLTIDPARLRARIFEFIGLDSQLPAPRPPHYNRQAQYPKLEMPAEFRKRLREHFAQELANCADRFGGPAERWSQL